MIIKSELRFKPQEKLLYTFKRTITKFYPENGKTQCQYPGDPLNGSISPLKFLYEPGDFLSIKCCEGYVLQSSKNDGLLYVYPMVLGQKKSLNAIMSKKYKFNVPFEEFQT